MNHKLDNWITTIPDVAAVAATATTSTTEATPFVSRFNLVTSPYQNQALHDWVRKHKPIPPECSICKQPFPKRRLDLCNISKCFNYDTYDERFENWFYACHKCHTNYDQTWLRPKFKKFWLGKRHSEETKKQISEKKKGRIFSEEHCRNIGKSKTGEKNPHYGKPRPEEWLRKIIEANTIDMSGRICTLCNTTKTYLGRNDRPRWYHLKDGSLICNQCYLNIRHRQKRIFKDPVNIGK